VGLLVGIASIVNRGINRLVEAQRGLADGLEDKLEKLSHKLERKLELLEGISVDGFMTDIHGDIGGRYGESNGEAIRRWLDYRVDYEYSGPPP
jgi:hypothetical protein